MEQDIRPRSLLAESAQAHALRFETPLSPTYGDAAGLRILVAFLVVGIGMLYARRFLIESIGMRGSPAESLTLVVALLAAYVVAQRTFVAVPWTQVGLRRFADWTRRERLFFLQASLMAAVVFTVVFSDHLLALLKQHGPGGFLLFSVFTGLLWGMVQEFLYRGWLQTELTRRFGSAIGLLVANALFTFGPLHSNHFVGPAGVRWSGLAAIFGIGLFFGLVYYRSGNVWIPAVLHGLWPPNMS